MGGNWASSPNIKRGTRFSVVIVFLSNYPRDSDEIWRDY